MLFVDSSLEIIEISLSDDESVSDVRSQPGINVINMRRQVQIKGSGAPDTISSEGLAQGKYHIYGSRIHPSVADISAGY